jgi:hypothetical protein
MTLNIMPLNSGHNGQVSQKYESTHTVMAGGTINQSTDLRMTPMLTEGYHTPFNPNNEKSGNRIGAVQKELKTNRA